MVPSSVEFGDLHPQGFRGNIGTLGAWVPPTLFPRAAILGEGTEALLPPAMERAATGWQGQTRATIEGTVDLFTGMPLIQVTDLELPVGRATFRLVRTRSSLHGATFSSIGSDGNKFAFDASDRIWDWLGAGWMISEQPILLIDDTRPDIVGSNPPTCWLILDAHRSIPFQWVHDLQRYEAPPRFRARLTYTQTEDGSGNLTSGEYGPLPSPPGDDPGGLSDFSHGWIKPPTEFKVSLYDGALTYTFVTVWEDVPPNSWNESYLTNHGGEPVWRESSLHRRPLLPDYFRPVEGEPTGDPREAHHVWARENNPGFGAPYYALATKIEDRDGHTVEIHYCTVEQKSMDSPQTENCTECLQTCLKKGQISHIVLRDKPDAGGAAGPVVWTLVYSHRHFVGVHPPRGEAFGDFFSVFSPEAYPWFVPDNTFVERRTVHGWSAIERIYVYPGELPAATLSQICLTTSPETAEPLCGLDQLAQVNRPVEQFIASSGGLGTELLDWRYCIRYDYNIAPPPSGYPMDDIFIWGQWTSWIGSGETAEPVSAHGPTSPPLLVLTTVYDRDETGAGATKLEPRDRRAVVYGPSSAPHVFQPLSHVYGPSPFGQNAAMEHGDSVLPWIEAIFDNAGLARVLAEEEWLSLEELLYQRHIDGTSTYPLTQAERDTIFEYATLRLSASPSEIGVATPSYRAPAMTAFWTSTPKYGQYITTGSENPTPNAADPRAFWDGHWATVGEMSSFRADGERHYRIHRFLRTPAQLNVDPEARREAFRPNYAGSGHFHYSPALPSVFVNPFQWHSYQGALWSGTLEELRATTEPPVLNEPRVLVVVDEFSTRAAMMAGRQWELDRTNEYGVLLEPAENNPDCYGPAEEGAIKPGMTARTVYEINAWGYVLKSRRWEYRDGTATVTTQGVGEEYIYSSLGTLFPDLPPETSTDPDEWNLTPRGFHRAIVLTEKRSVGWSVAEAAGGGAFKGLVEFFEYAADPPIDITDLEDFPWTTRIQMRARGVRSGSEGTKYYTHQWFYDPDRPTDLVCSVRFNTATTELLSAAPTWTDPVAIGDDPAYRTTWYLTQYDPYDGLTGVLKRPVSTQQIDPPVRQRPGGPLYFPVSKTFFDWDGNPVWHATGLLRDPLDPAAVEDSLQRLTWTYTLYGEYGRVHARVIDTAPNSLSATYDRPEYGGPQTINLEWDNYRFGTPWPRLPGPASLPMLEHVTAYWYDYRGRPVDIIEPTRRWARREVTVDADPAKEGDETTYQYVFAGLHSPQVPAGDSLATRYSAGEAGSISVFKGRDTSGSPEEVFHVRFVNTVPILPTAENRPLETDYELIKHVKYVLDATGRPVKAEEWEPFEVNGQIQMLQTGGRWINDLGEVYRVWEFGGNVNRWTRNYLGQRLRRYEGLVDTYWGNEGIDETMQGVTTHPYDSQFDGYDMVLKERTEFGFEHTNIWQPVVERRYVRDARTWAHYRNPDGTGGYHGEPPAADADAYVTIHKYDWRMRRVRTDEFEVGDAELPSGGPPRVRTVLSFLDYAGREALTVEYGPLMPAQLPNNLDPTKLEPAPVLPEPEDFLALSPRPVSIIQRLFDTGDRVIEERHIDVGATLTQGGTAPFTRTVSYYGLGGQQVFTQPAAGHAEVVTTDGIGQVIARSVVVRNAAGDWTRELSRTEFTFDNSGRVIEERHWERTSEVGDTLDLTNAVRSRRWYWYDYRGRRTAEADLGTEAFDEDSVPVYRATESVATRPAAGPELHDSGGGSWSVTGPTLPASARVSAFAYDESGRMVASSTPDGVITVFGYSGSRMLSSTVNPGGPDTERRATKLAYTEGRLTGRAVDGPLGERSASAGGDAAVSVAYGAPVMDDSFVVRSWDRTRPRFMRRDGAAGMASGWEFEFAYDFLGRLAQRIAADGTVTRYTYTALDELSTIEIGHFQDGVFVPGYPALPGGLAAADRIGFVEFHSRWLTDANGAALERREIVARVRRYNPGTTDPGRIVSHVVQEFDARGQLVRERQSVGAPVTAATPAVSYDWSYAAAAGPGENGCIRLTRITYPAVAGQAARLVDLEYGTPGSIDDALGRVTRLTTRIGAGGSPVSLIEYEYVAEDRPVLTRLGASEVELSLRSPAGIVGLDGLDGFGNPRRLAYRAGVGGPELYAAEYRHDAMDRIAGVRVTYGTQQVNTRSRGYAYDALGRLTRAEVGQISFAPGGTPDWTMTPGTLLRSDTWHLDVLDNWSLDADTPGGAGGRVMYGNLDLFGTPGARPGADPGLDSGYFRYSTTASSDLDLLRHSIDGTVDPPQTVTRDGLGRVICDGVYWYGYDAWGRLTQVNHVAAGGGPGALARHFVYDGLGRLVRIQRQAMGLLGDPTLKYVSSEHLFYDGARRIVDVVTAPVVTKTSALASGDAALAAQAVAADQEASPGTDGGTANATFEGYQLGPEQAQLSREYVWSPIGGVDELVAYFGGGAGRSKPWWVIQDATGDPAAVIEKPSPTVAARVCWRGGFEPYGGVLWAERPAGSSAPPPLKVGHKGLFVERLNAPPVVWGLQDQDERLTVDADLVVLMRNRALLPRLGRFLQPDPNATGVAVQPLLPSMGMAMWVPGPEVLLDSWTDDTLHALAYAASDPVTNGDPTGLFVGLIGLMVNTPMMDPYLDYNDEVVDAGMSMRDFIGGMLNAYAFNQRLDAEWVFDWSEPDDLYSRSAEYATGTGSWVGARASAAFGHGLIMAAQTPDGAPDWLSRLVKANSGPGVYILVNKQTGDIYIGRSRNVARRIKEHLRNHPAFKDVDARHICQFAYRVRGGKARRGAEQALIDAFSEWFKEGERKKLKNKIAGISERNKNRRAYMEAFRAFLRRLP